LKTKMGFRHKFAYSFFDFAAYKYFLVQGLGKSILYIFLVTLIFSTITNINTIITFTSQVSTVQDKLVHSTPQFELKDGLLSMDSKEPFYYKLDDNYIVIDTSGKTTSSVLDSHSDGVYIDSNVLILKQQYITMLTINFADFNELILTNENVPNILSIFKIIYPIILLTFKPILSFLETLISVFLLLGPVCRYISSFMGVKLNYSRACTLSFYAMTPPLLIEALLDVAGVVSAEFSFMFYIVALIYSVLAIKAIKNIDKSNLII